MSIFSLGAQALRILRRSPGFVVAAVLILAPVIGGATAMFSIVDAVLVRGMPYASADRLMTVLESSEQGQQRTPSYPTALDWQTQIGAKDGAMEGVTFVRGDAVNIGAAGADERAAVAYVMPGFFHLMGSRPRIGRGFSSGDERLDAPPVAIASYDFFMHHLNGDRNAVGRTVLVDSVPTTIVGVMPRGFAYPNFGGAGGWFPPSLWQPVAVFQRRSNALSLRALHVDSRTVVRLRQGSDSARAAAVLRTIERRLAATYPVEQAHWTSVAFQPIADEMFGPLRTILLFVSAAVGLLVLLACANVANLMLVRGTARDRELAIRAALGAGAGQVTGLVVAEAFILSVIAGVIGLVLAHNALAFVRAYAASQLPFATDFAIDARSAAFVVAATAAAALFVGLFPAIQGARGRLAERLRSGSASRTKGAGRRARGFLISLQLAVAIAVLIGAGVLAQSVRRVAAVDPGFDEGGTISFDVAPPRRRYESPAEAADLYKRIIDRLRALPGVQFSAAAGGALLPTKVESEAQRGAATPPTAAYHPISADYFGALRVRMTKGRGFTEQDMRAPAGFIITENLARQLWPGADPLGKRITVYRQSQARADFGQPITMPVIGVVADYRAFGRESDPPAQVFLPYTLEVWPWMSFVLRASSPGRVLRDVKSAVQSVEPAIQFRGQPNIARTSASFSDPRLFVMTLMSGFAVMAVVLAAIGLYGVVSYSAEQRTRELGIRIAIGASPGRICAVVVGEVALFAALGAAAGLGIAAASTRVLGALLFETAPVDLATFIAAPVVLAVVVAIAVLIPAMRAMKTDPLIALRTE